MMMVIIIMIIIIIMVIFKCLSLTEKEMGRLDNIREWTGQWRTEKKEGTGV